MHLPADLRRSCEHLVWRNLWMFFTEQKVLDCGEGWAFYSDKPRFQFITLNQALPLPSHSKLINLAKNPILTVDISYSNSKISKKSSTYLYVVAFNRYIISQICSLISKPSFGNRNEDDAFSPRTSSHCLDLNRIIFYHCRSRLSEDSTKPP